jgi:peptidoglycan/xylan/chitin deacetylase (PgdA/CDA1 family)
MYHRLGHETFDPWGLVVEEKRFEGHIEWLARHRSVLRLSEFALAHRERRLPGDAVAITFDDAYGSTITAAVPILEKFGVAATVFVPASLVERGGEFWWDELARLVFSFEGDLLRLNGTELRVPPGKALDARWRPSAAPSTPRQRLFHSIWSQLRDSQPTYRDAVMAELRSQILCERSGPIRPIGAGELRLLRSRNLEFGSHALTHSSLPALPASEKRREICDSVGHCAALTSAQPLTFAYPYGEYDAEAISLVKEAGYLCAVTSRHGFVSWDAEPFSLPRVRVGNWLPSALRAALNT